LFHCFEFFGDKEDILKAFTVNKNVVMNSCRSVLICYDFVSAS